MIIGYARVSTDDQKMDLQIQALEAAGCRQIYKDHGKSGSTFERNGLASALQALRPGNTLVVWRLDRLGRSLSGLVQLIDRLGDRDVHFRSITENIDTTSSGGRLMFHLMAALAEFERTLISERTRAGMAAARTKGKHIGRPKALDEDQIAIAVCWIRCGGFNLRQVAQKFNISERTLRRRVMELHDLVSNCEKLCNKSTDLPGLCA